MKEEIHVPAIVKRFDDVGLPQSKAQIIKSAFIPMAEMLEKFEAEISDIKQKEITPEVCAQAKAIRLKLVKVRTGTAEVHKTQKEEFLRGGKAIDGIKNVLEYAVIGYENELRAMEDHFINIEKDRKQKLHDERAALVAEHTDEKLPYNLGEMQDELWSTFYEGIKVSAAAKKKRLEEEEIAKFEAQRKKALHEQRKDSILDVWKYVPDLYLDDDFSKMSNEEWKEFTAGLEKEKLIEEKRVKEIEDELKRVKLEKEEELKIKQENEKKLQQELHVRHLQREKDLFAMGFKSAGPDYVLDGVWSTYWEQVHSMDDDLWPRYLIDIQTAIEKNIELQKLKQKQLEDDRKKKDEEQAEEKRKAEEKKAAKAPDKEKLIAFLDAIKLPDQPKLKSSESIIVLQDIIEKHNKFILWAKKEIDKI